MAQCSSANYQFIDTMGGIENDGGELYIWRGIVGGGGFGGWGWRWERLFLADKEELETALQYKWEPR